MQELPGPVHCALLVQVIQDCVAQRRLASSPLLAWRFSTGPVKLHTPQGLLSSGLLGQFATATVMSPFETTFESCAMPVQPVSSSLWLGSPVNVTKFAHWQVHCAVQVCRPLPEF